MLISSILLVITLLIVLDHFGSKATRKSVIQRARIHFLEAASVDEPLIESSQWQQLPAPVRKYCEFAGLENALPVQTLRLKQKGALRAGPQSPWLPLEAKSFHTTRPYSFVWFADLTVGLFISLKRVDDYYRNRSSMLIRLLSLFPIINVKKGAIAESNLIRFLSELPWYPSLVLDAGLRWEPIDDYSAKVVCTDDDLKVEGIFHFDQNGAIVSFESIRNRLVKGKEISTPWSLQVEDYHDVSGYQFPLKASAKWHFEEEEFPYYDVVITEAVVNEPFSWW